MSRRARSLPPPPREVEPSAVDPKDHVDADADTRDVDGKEPRPEDAPIQDQLEEIRDTQRELAEWMAKLAQAVESMDRRDELRGHFWRFLFEKVFELLNKMVDPAALKWEAFIAALFLLLLMSSSFTISTNGITVGGALEPVGEALSPVDTGPPDAELPQPGPPRRTR